MAEEDVVCELSVLRCHPVNCSRRPEAEAIVERAQSRQWRSCGGSSIRSLARDEPRTRAFLAEVDPAVESRYTQTAEGVNQPGGLMPPRRSVAGIAETSFICSLTVATPTAEPAWHP